jgi:hypothetical protein
MCAIAACSNRQGTVPSSQCLNSAAIKTGKWPSHALDKLQIFSGGGAAVAYPAAQPAQNSSSIFLNITVPLFFVVNGYLMSHLWLLRAICFIHRINK